MGRRGEGLVGECRGAGVVQLLPQLVPCNVTATWPHCGRCEVKGHEGRLGAFLIFLQSANAKRFPPSHFPARGAQCVCLEDKPNEVLQCEMIENISVIYVCSVSP